MFFDIFRVCSYIFCYCVQGFYVVYSCVCRFIVCIPSAFSDTY